MVSDFVKRAQAYHAEINALDNEQTEKEFKEWLASRDYSLYILKTGVDVVYGEYLHYKRYCLKRKKPRRFITWLGNQ